MCLVGLLGKGLFGFLPERDIYVVIGRFRWMIGAVGPPPTYSRGAGMRVRDGGGGVGACFCSEIGCGCIRFFVLLVYSGVCGSQGMWGKYRCCLGRGLLSVYRGSWVLESQHDHGVGRWRSVRLSMGGSYV